MTRVTHETTHARTTVTYRVEDAPPVTRRYAKTITFQPDLLAVGFTDGQATGFVLAGRRVVKKGLSESREREQYAQYQLSEAPDWVKPLLNPLRGEKKATLLTTFDLIRVMEGHAMTCEVLHIDTAAGEVTGRSEAVVRLYTPDELLEANRRSREAIDNPPPPMTREQAADLTRPLR